MYLQATASSGAGSKDDKSAAKAKKGALGVGDHLPDFSVETDASTDDNKVMQASKVRGVGSAPACEKGLRRGCLGAGEHDVAAVAQCALRMVATGIPSVDITARLACRISPRTMAL